MDQNIAKWLLRSFLQPIAPRANLSQAPTAYKVHTHNSKDFPDKWIVDGGATSQFTGHKSDFVSLQHITPKLVKGMNLNAVAIGTFHIQVTAISTQTQG